MIDVCITHNQLSIDGGKWYGFPYDQDVMDIVLELQLPVCLKPHCPMCEKRENDIKEAMKRR